MEASDGTGSGLAGEDVFGCGALHTHPRLLRLLFPVPRERGGRRCRPARGEGKRGCVGGGRSDADAKVAASGHHFSARKQNPGLKAAAIAYPVPLVFRGL